jgi:uncharacterized protein YukJ
MQYLLAFRFRHPITEALRQLSPGLHSIEPRPGGLAIDYLRSGLCNRKKFRTLPCADPGCSGGLDDVLDGVVGGAMIDPACWVYVFGEPWAADAHDRVFRFHPSRGLHDIHMNQGNDPTHDHQDGVFQDGALFFEHPQPYRRPSRWTALFLKFQSQSWCTDDTTGRSLAPPLSDCPHPPAS